MRSLPPKTLASNSLRTAQSPILQYFQFKIIDKINDLLTNQLITNKYSWLVNNRLTLTDHLFVI